MTYLDAALQILKSSRYPLSTREIIERALEERLIVTQGKTPEATMKTALYRAADADAELVKIEVPGRGRAKRGSVRWTVRER